MVDIDNDRFSTPDLYSAAACVVGGCTFKGLETIRPGFFNFVFNEPPIKCEAVLTKFHNRMLCVPAKEVIDAISMLKHQMNKQVKNE